MGVNQCVIAAKNEVLNTCGTILDESIVEQMIRTGKADISEKYYDCIAGAIRNYCTDIFEVLRKYEYNSELMRLYVTGGGAALIKNFGSFDEDRVVFIEDICATAKGYEKLAYNALLKESEQPKKPAKPKHSDTNAADTSEETNEKEVTDNADDQSDKPATES